MARPSFKYMALMANSKAKINRVDNPVQSGRDNSTQPAKFKGVKAILTPQSKVGYAGNNATKKGASQLKIAGVKGLGDSGLSQPT